METLDQKLRDITEAYFGVLGGGEYLPRFIAQIHQAYKEAGYVNTHEAGGVWMTHGPNDEHLHAMTGADWYDRFEKELDRVYEEGELVFLQSPDFMAIDVAARRAAGLQETTRG